MIPWGSGFQIVNRSSPSPGKNLIDDKGGEPATFGGIHRDGVDVDPIRTSARHDDDLADSGDGFP